MSVAFAQKAVSGQSLSVSQTPPQKAPASPVEMQACGEASWGTEQSALESQGRQRVGECGMHTKATSGKIATFWRQVQSSGQVVVHAREQTPP